MNKEKYERTELEIIVFAVEDVLNLSADQYELEKNTVFLPKL